MTLMGRFNELLHQLHSLPLSGTSAHQQPQQRQQQQQHHPHHHHHHHTPHHQHDHHPEQQQQHQSQTDERASQQSAPSEDEYYERASSASSHGIHSLDARTFGSEQARGRAQQQFSTGPNQKHRTSASSSPSSSSLAHNTAGVLSSGEVIHQQLKPSHRQAQKLRQQQQQQTLAVHATNQKALQPQSSSSGHKVSRHNSFTNSTPSQTSHAHSGLNRCENPSKAKVARSKSHHSSSSVTSSNPAPATNSSKNRAQRIEHLKLLLAQSDIAKQQIQQHKQQQRHRQRSISQPTQDRSGRQHVTRTTSSKRSCDQSPNKTVPAKPITKPTSNRASSKQESFIESALQSTKSAGRHNRTRQEYSSLPPLPSVNITARSASSSSSSASSSTSSTTSKSSHSQVHNTNNRIAAGNINKSVNLNIQPIVSKLNNSSQLKSEKKCTAKVNPSSSNKEAIQSIETVRSKARAAAPLQQQTPTGKTITTPNIIATSFAASNTKAVKSLSVSPCKPIATNNATVGRHSRAASTTTTTTTTNPSTVDPSAVMRNSKKKHETTSPTPSSTPNPLPDGDQNDAQSSVLQTKSVNKQVTMDLVNNNHTNNNNINGKDDTAEPDTKMLTKGGADEATLPVEESFATKFARKMNKVATLARKSSNAANLSTQALRSSIEKSLNKASKQTKSSKVSSNNKENASEGCFIHRYLNGHLTRQHPDIISGKTCYDLPVKDLALLSSKMVASCTGPHGGLLTISAAPSKPFDLADQVDFIDEDYPDSSLSSSGQELHSPHRQPISAGSSATSDESLGSSTNSSPINSPANDEKASIAGLDDWHCARDFAYGISTSLYELHPFSKSNAGDPIADSFALATRENSAVIALADGVNWGQRSSLASRSAIHGCMDYLNRALYSRAESTQIKNTLDVFVALLRSFRAAHNLILAQGGHLTTLCAAVICQLKDSNRFIVCTCNVGDSFAYVWSQQFGVREITEGSHDIFSMRDMRDALGALGPVSGDEPELNNLTVSMTVVDEGDIVFLTSDGITDNFDPVVGKFAMPRKDTDIIHDPNNKPDGKKSDDNNNNSSSNNNNNNHNHAKKDKTDGNTKERKKVQRSTSNPERRSANFTSKGLPLVSGKQRHELTLLRMEDLISNGVNTVQEYSAESEPSTAGGRKNNSSTMSAKELCSVMVDFATKLSVAKRRILEDEELYSEDDDGTLADDEAHKRQKARRRKVGGRLMQMPGKLDHASIAAVEVGFYGEMLTANRARHHLPRPAKIVNHSKSFSEARYNLKAKATLARFESQESLDEYCESGPI